MGDTRIIINLINDQVYRLEDMINDIKSSEYLDSMISSKAFLLCYEYEKNFLLTIKRMMEVK